MRPGRSLGVHYSQQLLAPKSRYRRTGDGQQLVGDEDGRVILVLVDGVLSPLAQVLLH